MLSPNHPWVLMLTAMLFSVLLLNSTEARMIENHIAGETPTHRHQRGAPTPETKGGEGKEGGTSDVFNGYYDFLINEGSFKFWSIFQVFTAALLIYSAFAAVYYARYNYEPPADDFGADILFKRSGRMVSSKSNTFRSSPTLDTQTFQRIMDSVSKKKSS